MSIKIKPGFNPSDTLSFHNISLKNKSGASNTVTYRVEHVWGLSANIPVEEPIIYMEIHDRRNLWAQAFISMPLSMFVRKFSPVSEEDKFWHDTTTKA